MTIAISELLDVFDCKSSAPAIMDAVLHGRVAAMRDLLTRALAKCGELGFESDELLSLYNRLSAVHQARLLVSSEFGELIQIPPMSDNDAMANWVARTRHALQRENMVFDLARGVQPEIEAHADFDQDLFSPLGDQIIRKSGGNWILQSPPTVGEVITLDFDSPVAHSHEDRSGILSHAPLPWTAADREVVVAKYNLALSIIDEVEPIYGALIRNFTRRIIPRKAVEASAFHGSAMHGSEHVPRQPGSIRVLNPHTHDQLIVTCMEQLLHESTHNFLAAYEAGHENFFPAVHIYRPVSCWSGNYIPNSSLAHAIFIYYACHKLFEGYFKKIQSSGEEEDNQATRRLYIFSVGFLTTQRLRDQFVTRHRPPDGLLDTLDIIQDRMMQAHNVELGHRKAA